MKVRDVMHSGAEWVGPDTLIWEVAKIMRDKDIGAIPVGENDRLVGMITDRDITCRVLAEGLDVKRLKAGDIMSRGIFYCRADEDVDDAIHIMEKKQVRRLPVINDKKRMVGMLSLGDISHKVPRSLAGEALEAVSAHHE
jgi:CBS domain-containing protein